MEDESLSNVFGGAFWDLALLEQIRDSLTEIKDGILKVRRSSRLDFSERLKLGAGVFHEGKEGLLCLFSFLLFVVDFLSCVFDEFLDDVE